MSTTLLAGANKSAGLAASLRRLLPDLIFGVLVIYNTIRLFRHAMWRDELQAFTLTAAANTPLDLFAKLGYEGHPGLWYLLLWVITRFTGDPFFMQVAHLLIALGVWVLIWRLSPFRPIEKLLLLLGFCLFWEYFIISRGYALMVLLGFGFIALRTARPTDRFWPFVLLGLLANTEVFGTIWSLGLGAFFLWQERREWRSTLVGAALFAACLAVALVSMVPAPDYMLVQAKPGLEFGHLNKPLRYVVFAFFPFIWPFAPDALRTLGNWGAALAATPFGGNPAEQLVLLITGAPTSALLTLALLAAPLVACWREDAGRPIRHDLCWCSSLRAALAISRLAASSWHPVHHPGWDGVDVAERHAAGASSLMGLYRLARGQCARRADDARRGQPALLARPQHRPVA